MHIPFHGLLYNKASLTYMIEMSSPSDICQVTNLVKNSKLLLQLVKNFINIILFRKVQNIHLSVAALSELSDASVTLPGDVVPPKFTQLLKDIEGVEGELIRFDCRVIGHPTPVIKWYRGRNQIQSSADFQVQIHISSSLLKISRHIMTYRDIS